MNNCPISANFGQNQNCLKTLYGIQFLIVWNGQKTSLASVPLNSYLIRIPISFSDPDPVPRYSHVQANVHPTFQSKGQKMPFHGNDRTMNMNPLILANVQNSPYFKVSDAGLAAWTNYLNRHQSKMSSSKQMYL
jgi:hypothetical protein